MSDGHLTPALSAVWVVPLLALAGLLWYLLPHERETVAVTTPKSTTEPMRDVQTKSAFLGSAPGSWISIGSSPNEYVNKQIYSGTGEQLGTVKDVLVGPDGKMALVGKRMAALQVCQKATCLRRCPGA